MIKIIYKPKDEKELDSINVLTYSIAYKSNGTFLHYEPENKETLDKPIENAIEIDHIKSIERINLERSI